MKKVKNYIDGKWIQGSGKEAGHSYCPFDKNKQIAQFNISTKKDINNAILAADNAFKFWKNVPAPKRGDMLFKVAEIMENRFNTLSNAIALEMGKTLGAAQGEVKFSINHLKFYAGEGRRIKGTIIPGDEENIDVMVKKEPLGATLIITPWNFPLAIPVWKIAPALVTGNTVIFKPSSETPLIGQLLIEIFEEAGFPQGTINFVVTSGENLNNVLQNKKIKAISFTGSNKIGQHIYNTANNHQKRILLEMGGNNPIIILKDADLDKSAELVIQGGFFNAGQSCTATERIIIDKTIKDEFIKNLVKKMKEIKIGTPLRQDVDIGPQINQHEMEETMRLVESAVQEGAEIVYQNNPPNPTTLESGYFVKPTLLTNVKSSMKIAKEEIFGPVISILEANNTEHAIDLANDIEFGLSASVCTKNISDMNYVVNNLDVGIVKVNMATTGNYIQAPFGGYKNSSTGSYKEQGEEGLDFYLKEKTIYVDNN